MFRWKIEEVHRQTKQDQGLEAMQLLSYTGLKNLNILSFVATSFGYSLKKVVYELAEVFPHLMLDKKSNVSKLCKIFVFYRLFKVVVECFRGLKRRRFIKFKSYPENVPMLNLVF